MVAASAALPAAQLALRADDKPIFCAREWLSDATSVKIRSDGDFSAADAGTNTLRCYDNSRVAVSTGPNANDMYILVDGGSAGAIVFDALIFEGHNFDAANDVVVVRCADTLAAGVLDPAEPLIVTEINSSALVDDRNTYLMSTQYTARYVEIRIKGVAPAARTVTQMYLTVQNQLQLKTNEPIDIDSRVGSHSTTASRSGVIQTTEHNTNLWTADGFNFWVWLSANTVFVQNTFTESNSYARKIFYIEDPNSVPNTARFVKLQGSKLIMPNISNSQRLWQVPSMIEDGPSLDP